MKQNCWEVMNCGLEPGGAKADEIGVCPAAIDSKYHERNDGTNGGRYCWNIPGTPCTDHVENPIEPNYLDCLECDFLYQVMEEEGSLFHP